MSRYVTLSALMFFTGLGTAPAQWPDCPNAEVRGLDVAPALLSPDSAGAAARAASGGAVVTQHHAPRSVGASLPDYAALAAGPQQVRLLPGQREFVFSMYGAPGEPDRFRQLVAVMREQHLGNGFDPGPGPGPNSRPLFDHLAEVGWPVVCYSGGEMQIKGGRAVLGPQHEAVAGVHGSRRAFHRGPIGRMGLLLPQPVAGGILVARCVRKGFRRFQTPDETAGTGRLRPAPRQPRGNATTW